jgi:TIR domain
MKLFISWSGDVSQGAANILRQWLPDILPAVTPFITTTDVDKGARWLTEISQELSDSNFGIACLTPENLKSTWLAFEAGALAKQHQRGRVATILFNLEISQIPPPLNMFQATPFVENEVQKLINDINTRFLRMPVGAKTSSTACFPYFGQGFETMLLEF